MFYEGEVCKSRISGRCYVIVRVIEHGRVAVCRLLGNDIGSLVRVLMDDLT